VVTDQDKGISEPDWSKAHWQSDLGRFIYNAVVELSLAEDGAAETLC